MSFFQVRASPRERDLFLIAVSLRCAKEPEQRADLAAEVANTSSGGGLVKSPKANFREAMRGFPSP